MTPDIVLAETHEFYFLFWVLSLFGLEFLNQLYSLSGILIFLGKHYLRVLVLIGLELEIVYKESLCTQ